MFINLSLFNKDEKCFIFQKNKKINLNGLKLKTLPLNELVNFSSVIQTDESEDLFIKITRSKYGANNGHRKEQRKPNRLKFIFREVLAERLFFTIRVLKEYRHSKKLAKIGINTPEAYGAGFFVSNMNTYSGIIFYKKHENLVSAQEVLLTSESVEIKELLLQKIADDYKIIAKNKLHFRDFHMSNILFDPVSHELYWIDVSLDKLSRF